MLARFGFAPGDISDIISGMTTVTITPTPDGRHRVTLMMAGRPVDAHTRTYDQRRAATTYAAQLGRAERSGTARSLLDRATRHLTRTAIAHAIGVDRSTVGAWSRGVAPNQAALDRLAALVADLAARTCTACTNGYINLGNGATGPCMVCNPNGAR